MSSDDFIDLGDRTLRSRRLVPQRSDGLERTTLVFLHEGLGCIEMWRDFPQKLCDATMCAGVVYDRTAYGRSSPCPSDPGLRYMEIEADDFTTIAGLVINESGKVPPVGEQFKFRGLEVEVLEADERRIGRLRVSRAVEENASEMTAN